MKLNQFLCSKEGGGELTEEQQVALKQVPVVSPIEKKKSAIQSAVSGETDETKESSNIKMSVAEELASKLIQTGDIAKKPVSKMSKKEQLHAMKDKIPKFYLLENRVDKNGRKPNDPNYDPSSIHIPPEEYKTLTDGMKRFWELKKDNMDKLILYRFGDWYVLYYDDRELASKIIELSLVNAPGIP